MLLCFGKCLGQSSIHAKAKKEANISKLINKHGLTITYSIQITDEVNI